MLSKPMTATSSGTDSPARRTRAMNPTALRSVAHMTAVGRSARARKRSAACVPPISPFSAHGRKCVGSGARPWSTSVWWYAA